MSRHLHPTKDRFLLVKLPPCEWLISPLRRSELRRLDWEAPLREALVNKPLDFDNVLLMPKQCIRYKCNRNMLALFSLPCQRIIVAKLLLCAETESSTAQDIRATKENPKLFKSAQLENNLSQSSIPCTEKRMNFVKDDERKSKSGRKLWITGTEEVVNCVFPVKYYLHLFLCEKTENDWLLKCTSFVK